MAYAPDIDICVPSNETSDAHKFKKGHQALFLVYNIGIGRQNLARVLRNISGQNVGLFSFNLLFLISTLKF